MNNFFLYKRIINNKLRNIKNKLILNINNLSDGHILTSLSMLFLTTSAILTFYNLSYALISLYFSLFIILLYIYLSYKKIEHKLNSPIQKWVKFLLQKLENSFTLKNVTKIILFIILSLFIRYVIVCFEKGNLENLFLIKNFSLDFSFGICLFIINKITNLSLSDLNINLLSSKLKSFLLASKSKYLDFSRWVISIFIKLFIKWYLNKDVEYTNNVNNIKGIRPDDRSTSPRPSPSLSENSSIVNTAIWDSNSGMVEVPGHVPTTLDKGKEKATSPIVDDTTSRSKRGISDVSDVDTQLPRRSFMDNTNRAMWSIFTGNPTSDDEPNRRSITRSAIVNRSSREVSIVRSTAGSRVSFGAIPIHSASPEIGSYSPSSQRVLERGLSNSPESGNHSPSYLNLLNREFTRSPDIGISGIPGLIRSASPGAVPSIEDGNPFTETVSSGRLGLIRSASPDTGASVRPILIRSASPEVGVLGRPILIRSTSPEPGPSGRAISDVRPSSPLFARETSVEVIPTYTLHEYTYATVEDIAANPNIRLAGTAPPQSYLEVKDVNVPITRYGMSYRPEASGELAFHWIGNNLHWYATVPNSFVAQTIDIPDRLPFGPFHVNSLYQGAGLQVDLPNLTGQALKTINSKKINLINLWLEKLIDSSYVFDTKRVGGKLLLFWNAGKNPYFLIHPSCPGIRPILEEQKGKQTLIKIIAYQEAYYRGVELKRDIMEELTSMLRTVAKHDDNLTVRNLSPNILGKIDALSHYENVPSLDLPVKNYLAEIKERRQDSDAYLNMVKIDLERNKAAFPQIRYTPSSSGAATRGLRRANLSAIAYR